MPASGSGSLYPLKLESRSSNLRSATFSGEIVGSLGGYAVYPYNKGHKISGDTLTYHLPSEYNVSVDKDYVADSQAASVDAARESANFALFAKIVQDAESSSSVTGSSSATFKHLAGLLCIKIDKMPATTCTLTVTADKKISGDFRVNLTESEPRIRTDESSSDNSVSIISSGGTQNEPCVYYIPMPADDYSLTVRLGYKSPKDGEFASCTAVKTVEIERAKVKRVKVTYDTMYKGGYKVIAGHKFIDLGLPSGLLWAETNIGSDVVTSGGDYFEWGGIVPNLSFNTDASSTKATFPDGFFSGKDVLKLPDDNDAARKLWHSSCRMPTNDEVNELKDNTDQSRTSRTDSNGNKADGWEFKSKAEGNSNSVFIQYTGYRRDGGSYGSGYGYYWTSNLTPTLEKEGVFSDDYNYNRANIFCFNYNNWIAPISYENRFHGCGIRPVHDPNSK